MTDLIVCRRVLRALARWSWLALLVAAAVYLTASSAIENGGTQMYQGRSIVVITSRAKDAVSYAYGNYLLNIQASMARNSKVLSAAVAELPSEYKNTSVAELQAMVTTEALSEGIVYINVTGKDRSFVAAVSEAVGKAYLEYFRNNNLYDDIALFDPGNYAAPVVVEVEDDARVGIIGATVIALILTVFIFIAFTVYSPKFLSSVEFSEEVMVISCIPEHNIK